MVKGRLHHQISANRSSKSFPITSTLQVIKDENTRIDSKSNWDKVHSSIRPNICLIKQLRPIVIFKQLLVNVYKSLVLSRFRYSSTVLVECTKSTKNEMQVLQNRSLRIMGKSLESSPRPRMRSPQACGLHRERERII